VLVIVLKKQSGTLLNECSILNTVTDEGVGLQALCFVSCLTVPFSHDCIQNTTWPLVTSLLILWVELEQALMDV